MEVRIGIRETARELTFESDLSASELEQQVASALNGSVKVLALGDNKGRKFVVSADALAYVEIGAEESRRVGFIA